MSEPRYSVRSEKDVTDICRYLGQRSRTAADKFLTAFLKGARRHARFPGIGRARDDLQPGLRSFVVDRYVVFFRAVEDTIQIVRVLHGSRNIDSGAIGD